MRPKIKPKANERSPKWKVEETRGKDRGRVGKERWGRNGRKEGRKEAKEKGGKWK